MPTCTDGGKGAALAEQISYRKSLFPLQVKSIDEHKGIFEGYLSTFGNVDEVGDVVVGGAFRKTLNDAYQAKTAKQSPFLLPILWQHNPMEPIGGFLEMQEDETGLWVRGWIDRETDLGKRAYSGLKNGYLGGLSIGYRVIREDVRAGVRNLLEVALIEGSIVTFPANQQATVNQEDVKAGRAISRANKARITAAMERVQDALDQLQALLDSVAEDEEEGPSPEEETDTLNTSQDGPVQTTQKRDQLQALQLTQLLADMQTSVLKLR